MKSPPSADEFEQNTMELGDRLPQIDKKRHRYPYCIVWTPIPLLTWLFPFIGHMGIAMSSGVIRDFAGPYYVSEDNMAFGNPTRYLRLNPAKIASPNNGWDTSVSSASEEYKHRMHNLCCDNCHSHVAMALNFMEYDKSSSWNMVTLAAKLFFFGKYVSFAGFLKTWLPFTILATATILLVVLL
ncbi:transmembrane protein 222 [Nematostella vectensis]|uniref:transmembrane protein 222 n=1 Tax=Nematostella vectensis TaxID=45351 RepID=UPI0020773FD2|nr:transmembrane protein 222 [Nematostella vectensis]